jgi:hypothetical protein
MRNLNMDSASTTQPKALSIAAVSSWVWLAMMIGASIALRLAMNTKFAAPTVLTDELTYSQLAEQVADGDLWLTGYGIVYPLFLAPSWALAHLGTDAYTAMKTTNAVLVSLTAIPVFLWSRMMMRPGYALLAAGLTLALPTMAFSGLIMTENAFVLVLTIAAWALAVAVQRPTIINQALALVAIFIAYETRTQAVILILAIPLVVALATVANARAAGPFSLTDLCRRLARFWVFAGVGLIAIVIGLVLTATSGWRWSSFLQAYGVTTSGQYKPTTVAQYFAWHLGDAALAVGVIPLAAFALLIGMAILNRSKSDAERAFLATSVVIVPAVILLVAAFASYYAQRVNERNMFCIFPMIFIAFALWGDRRFPRPAKTAAVAAAVVGVLVMSIPFEYLYQRSPSTETWAIVLPEFLSRHVPGGTNSVQILIAVSLAIALLGFGFLRPRAAVVAIPVALVCYFAVSQAAVVHTIAKASQGYRNVPSLGVDASWIDPRVPTGTTVGFVSGTLLSPKDEQVVWWETGFFNRTALQWIAWGRDVIADPVTGTVTTPEGAAAVLPPYLMTPISARFAGAVIADRGSYLLVEPSKPYRLINAVGGVYADGWTAKTATIDIFETTLGTSVRLVLSRPIAPGASDVTVDVAPLELASDGTSTTGAIVASQSTNVTLGGTQTIDVPALGRPYRVTVTVASPFTPTQIGLADTREMGVQMRAEIGSTVLVP